MDYRMPKEKYMRFAGGKSKALTFSYDDGVKCDIRLVDIFNKYCLKGTFNINSGLFGKGRHSNMTEEEVYELFSKSVHEVALHGEKHLFLDKVTTPEVIKELIENRLYLENKFNRIVKGFAYPYNAYNDKVIEILKLLGIDYARTTESSFAFDIPKDWLKLKPTCHHNDLKDETLANKFLNKKPEDEFKHREPWLFYVWGHSYEFEDNKNWEIMENFANKVAFNNDIWYATNGEIYEYIKAYDSLIFSADGERVKNPSCLTVWIELRGKVYKIDSGKELVFDRE